MFQDSHNIKVEYRKYVQDSHSNKVESQKLCSRKFFPRLVHKLGTSFFLDSNCTYSSIINPTVRRFSGILLATKKEPMDEYLKTDTRKSHETYYGI